MRPSAQRLLVAALALVLLGPCPLLSRAAPVDPAGPVAAVQRLAARVVPAVASLFDFQLIPGDNATGMDVYELLNTPRAPGRVAVRGSSAVALAQGLGHYLRYHTRSQLSWTGDHLSRAVAAGGPLPALAPGDPAREVDWMALHGVNAPLAPAGTEHVLRGLFGELGFSDAELADWFAGPAFLAWFRMGNVQRWGGPLPLAWVEAQRALQVRVLARMRELGMTPVLPMFAGHVPPAWAARFPGSRAARSAAWNGFNETYRTWTLDPADPAFARLGRRFLELQREAYGTDHLYAADTYNEMPPPSSDPRFLAAAARAVFGAMDAADPRGVWLMQSWVFSNNPEFWGPEQVRAFLSGVPDDRAVVLDLFAEFAPLWRRTEGFYGKRWVWCLLHSFGGTPGLWGDLAHVLAQPHADRRASQGFAGVGLAMEAIGHNYVVFEAMLEARWRQSAPDDLRRWVAEYALRRCGADVCGGEELRAMVAAWQSLVANVYSSPFHNVSLAELRPSLGAQARHAGSGGPVAVGRLEDLVAAWRALASPAVSRCAGAVQTLQSDVAVVGREVLGNLFGLALGRLRQSYAARNRTALALAGRQLLELIRGMDALMGATPGTLLGRWVADARAWGRTEEQRALLEFNARNQVTRWGPDANINDYARKPWGGLYASYYLPRWQLFVAEVLRAVDEGRDFVQQDFDGRCSLFEAAWQTAHDDTLPVDPVGDALEISRRLIAQWNL
eukprot:m51a1_g10320 putative alpha-n-acetylglucosaminidase (729) ;mRNA; f:42273-44597